MQRFMSVWPSASLSFSLLQIALEEARDAAVVAAVGRRARRASRTSIVPGACAGRR